MRKVALIIPAFNEEDRIGPVLLAAVRSSLTSEVIVVNDGSADRTGEVAAKIKGVRVVNLNPNQGKGAAMMMGAKETDAEILAFLDADLKGITPDHIDSIIKPVIDRRCDMCVGVFRGGKFWSNTGQIIFPYISGQRAMTRTLFQRIPNLKDKGYGVEIAIYDYLKRRKDVRQERVVLRGVSNSYKEAKFGFVKGIKARQKMYSEMYRVRMRNLQTDREEKFGELEEDLRVALKKLRKTTRARKRSRRY